MCKPHEKITCEITTRCEETIAQQNIEKLEMLLSYGFGIVYHRSNYIILKKHNHKDIIAWNYLLPYKQGNKRGHTHLNKLETGKMIIDSILKQHFPKSKSFWILRSFIRIADDSYLYKKDVEMLIQTKRDKGNCKTIKKEFNIRKKGRNY